ncbi:hypothetical protein [Sphingomonas sp. CROZ-RG-20F-R02-07]|uniref:hypothetical protein n=1 Tax=Sphingomonas sp. CROZ-RG-20F-R02-07 TaxID=2914832 RepID=UPI001F591DE9|nr:hypothetical protein [Sphingomonas sp. CROZ-RG-20F-R02-07]
MRAYLLGAAAAGVVTPAMGDLAGYQFEWAPMVMGVSSCVIVRVYMGLADKSREGWLADLAITALTVLFTVGIVISSRPSLLMALVLGTGLGAIGAGLIGIAEKKTSAVLGEETADDVTGGEVGRSLRRGFRKPVNTRPPDDQIAALIQLDRDRP